MYDKIAYVAAVAAIVGAYSPACPNWVHSADSEVPFGLTIWGYDHDVSYGYPAGMSVEPINPVVVPPVPE